ncbi:MAG TPA: hypothetical protein VGD99_05395 [Anaerolineae bacterium]|jgi:hypothetical protein
MKIRKLQRLENDEGWVDDGYCYEKANGQVVFRYNAVTWGRIGARYNVQLRDTGARLAEVHKVIPTGESLRWLPVEEMPGDIEELKATLDKACGFPKVQHVAKPVVG